MTEIEKLKDGVYEKVMSRRFAEVLKEALAEDQVRAEEEDVDAEEAVGYLSSYLQQVIRLCLKDIADRDEENSVDHQLALTNELIASLAKKTEELGGGQEVANAPFLLKSLEHKKNTLLPRRWERPATSFTRSFLFTNSKKDVSMVHELTKEIASSDRIDFLISFIRFSGLQLLLPALRLFTARGGHLRIVTTTYMGATDPKAIEVLASLPHTEVRISYDVKETRLHAKSYMFYRESGYSTAYIGSSNLSHAAIAEGMEWNMKVTAQDQPHIIDKMSATFETYWHSEDFTSYEPQKDEEKLRRAIDRERGRSSGTDASSYAFDIQPYPYQQAILDALDTERHGKDRWYNLVVAATGTGKTAISAFDYRRFAASRKEGTRLLFIAHREEILKQSLSCFRQVMKDPDFGALAVGGHRASHVEHLFMSIQTLNSQRFFEKMDPYYYDMIIVDEFHHAAARSYQHLLTHFHPKILLGLTATPERMDGGRHPLLFRRTHRRRNTPARCHRAAPSLPFPLLRRHRSGEPCRDQVDRRRVRRERARTSLHRRRRTGQPARPRHRRRPPSLHRRHSRRESTRLLRLEETRAFHGRLLQSARHTCPRTRCRYTGSRKKCSAGTPRRRGASHPLRRRPLQ